MLLVLANEPLEEGIGRLSLGVGAPKSNEPREPIRSSQLPGVAELTRVGADGNGPVDHVCWECGIRPSTSAVVLPELTGDGAVGILSGAHSSRLPNDDSDVNLVRADTADLILGALMLCKEALDPLLPTGVSIVSDLLLIVLPLTS